MFVKWIKVRVKTIDGEKTKVKVNLPVSLASIGLKLATKFSPELKGSELENIDLDELKRTWMNKMQDNCIFISAKERTNIDALKALLYERVKQIHITRFPYNDFLFQQYDEE